jgi:hypothetical protein
VIVERPREFYETEEDRRHEREVAQRASLAWSCRLIKTKRAFAADFAAVRGKRITALVECKWRDYTLERLDGWGGLMLSAEKWARLRMLSPVLRVPTIIVAECNGVLWWHSATTRFQHDGLDLDGRTDRGDWQDVEPVVMFRKQRFKRIADHAPPPGILFMPRTVDEIEARHG